MKTVADFKREIKVGTRLHTVNHTLSKRDADGNVLRLLDGLPEYCDEDRGEATVSAVMATKFAIGRTKQDGKVYDSWMDYPAASLSKVRDNKITIFEIHRSRGLVPILTYTIL